MEDSIKFAEWIAENHYRLKDVVNGVKYWVKENVLHTTSVLYELYSKDK